jgi:hypothetical protein
MLWLCDQALPTDRNLLDDFDIQIDYNIVDDCKALSPVAKASLVIGKPILDNV